MSWFNKLNRNMPSYQDKKSHCGDKTIMYGRSISPMGFTILFLDIFVLNQCPGWLDKKKNGQTALTTTKVFVGSRWQTLCVWSELLTKVFVADVDVIDEGGEVPEQAFGQVGMDRGGVQQADMEGRLTHSTHLV